MVGQNLKVVRLLGVEQIELYFSIQIIPMQEFIVQIVEKDWF
jgi:hypothetical protein